MPKTKEDIEKELEEERVKTQGLCNRILDRWDSAEFKNMTMENKKTIERVNTRQAQILRERKKNAQNNNGPIGSIDRCPIKE